MPYYCGDCNMILNSAEQVQQHREGRRHNLKADGLRQTPGYELQGIYEVEVGFRPDKSKKKPRKSRGNDRSRRGIPTLCHQDHNCDNHEGPQEKSQKCEHKHQLAKCQIPFCQKMYLISSYSGSKGELDAVLSDIGFQDGGKNVAHAICESLKTCNGDIDGIVSLVTDVLQAPTTDFSVEMGQIELRSYLIENITSELSCSTCTAENDFEGEEYDAFEQYKGRLHFHQKIFVDFSIALTSNGLLPKALLYTLIQKILLGSKSPAALLPQRMPKHLSDHAVCISCKLFAAVVESDGTLPLEYKKLLMSIRTFDARLTEKLEGIISAI
eukprot:TRINITY_DN9258_c0_g1_i1.p1 TRINITY_DN9258_c0_g1~~TRINITY_DN9258_c0_g1_i1.p1  ORF type:complete len:341 (+),score=37.98 TRINITY_DN9258_c0_g1_i1:46-1023(+)